MLTQHCIPRSIKFVAMIRFNWTADRLKRRRERASEKNKKNQLFQSRYRLYFNLFWIVRRRKKKRVIKESKKKKRVVYTERFLYYNHSSHAGYGSVFFKEPIKRNAYKEVMEEVGWLRLATSSRLEYVHHAVSLVWIKPMNFYSFSSIRKKKKAKANGVITSPPPPFFFF